MSIRPCYTWPNEAFSLKVYLDSPKHRLFIIENMFYNNTWISKCASRISERDFFVEIQCWHHSGWHAYHSKIAKIHESKCGSNISELKDACFASREYLLCEIPPWLARIHRVAEAWYNSCNLHIGDATPHDVSKAVRVMNTKALSTSKTGQQHVLLAGHFRAMLVQLLAFLFDNNGHDQNPLIFFDAAYSH